MPLFELKRDNKNLIVGVITREEVSFSDENKEMHSLFNSFLKQLLGIDFVKGRFPINAHLLSTKKVYEIDALGLNSENNPVIIEYGRRNKTISQTLGYYSNFKKHNWADFENIVKNKLGSGRKVNWDKIVVLIIAKKIQKGEFETVKFLKGVKKGFGFHFFSYHYFSNFLILNEEKLEKDKDMAIDESIYNIVNRYRGNKENLLNLHRDIMEKGGFHMLPFRNKLRYHSPVDTSLIFELRVEPHRIFIKPLKKQYRHNRIKDITNLNFNEVIPIIKGLET